MGKIDFITIDQKQGNPNNVERHYKFILSKKELKIVANMLLCNYPKENYACYIFIHGGKSENYYHLLESNQANDFKVLWYGQKYIKINSIKSLVFYFLNLIFSSSYGLIKGLNVEKLNPILEEGIDHSLMVSFLSLSKNESEAFETSFFKNASNIKFSPEEYISNYKSFFHFTFDAGTYSDDDKGYLCQCAYGRECSGELLKIIEYTSKRW